jgi:hypothetical protein
VSFIYRKKKPFVLRVDSADDRNHHSTSFHAAADKGVLLLAEFHGRGRRSRSRPRRVTDDENHTTSVNTSAQHATEKRLRPAQISTGGNTSAAHLPRLLPAPPVVQCLPVGFLVKFPFSPFCFSTSLKKTKKEE